MLTLTDDARVPTARACALASLLALAALLGGGCGETSGSGGDGGTAGSGDAGDPTCSGNTSFSPCGVPVMSGTGSSPTITKVTMAKCFSIGATLAAVIEYGDMDGDAAKVNVLTTINGVMDTVEVPIMGGAGLTTGMITLSGGSAFQSSTSGRNAMISLAVVDQAGNSSSPYCANFKISAP